MDDQQNGTRTARGPESQALQTGARAITQSTLRMRTNGPRREDRKTFVTQHTEEIPSCATGHSLSAQVQLVLPDPGPFFSWRGPRLLHRAYRVPPPLSTVGNLPSIGHPRQRPRLGENRKRIPTSHAPVVLVLRTRTNISWPGRPWLRAEQPPPSSHDVVPVQSPRYLDLVAPEASLTAGAAHSIQRADGYLSLPWRSHAC